MGHFTCPGMCRYVYRYVVCRFIYLALLSFGPEEVSSLVFLLIEHHRSHSGQPSIKETVGRQVSRWYTGDRRIAASPDKLFVCFASRRWVKTITSDFVFLTSLFVLFISFNFFGVCCCLRLSSGLNGRCGETHKGNQESRHTHLRLFVCWKQKKWCGACVFV